MFLAQTRTVGPVVPPRKTDDVFAFPEAAERGSSLPCGETLRSREFDA